MSNKKKAETLPLVKNNLLNNDDHIDWSDQELDELVGDPLEHVLEQMRRRPQNVSRLQYYRSMLFFSVLCFILGAVVSCLVMIFIWNPTLRTFPNALKDTVITQKIVHYTDVNSIKTFYRFLTNQIHVAGSHADKETADYIYSTWKKQGLDAHLVPYSVFLSYPNKEKFNRVSVVLNNRTEMFHSTSWEKILHSLGKNNSEIYPPFAAYSPSTVEPLFGDPVYANYGEFEDFLLLRKKAIPLERCIAIIRYGKISPAQKVNFAEQFGIKGVILYPDPADYAMHGLKDVYPSSIHLPSLGVPYSSLNLLKGDPLTPLYPSIENAYRIQEEKAKLPKIPVFPINYEDASYILRNITGSKSPETWKGALPNVEYLIGSGYKNNAKIKMEVNNNNTQVMIYNVIGIIPGSDEPDRFVLLGNHRDSWTYGSLDPSSGTSAMLEISHIFGKLLKEGWKPRRSILFCSWSASLYGLIGSREWIEENQKNLIEKIVAYIDVSMAVEGNTTLAIQSTPLMYRVFSEAAKKIPNPNALEVSNGLLSVFNSWLNHSSQNLINPSLPEFRNLDDSSDHATFLFGFGIPSANLKYSCYKTVTVCSPLIHTLYETSAVQSKLIDSEFQYHKALTQLWAEVTHQLADLPLIPFEIRDYAAFLNYSAKILKKQLVNLKIIQHDDLDAVVNLFQKEVNKFYQNKRKINISNFYAVRAFNDKLLLLEKAFIKTENLPDNYFRHIILSPSHYRNRAENSFSNIKDLLYDYENSNDATNQNEIIENIKKNLSILIFLIKSATSILQENN